VVFTDDAVAVPLAVKGRPPSGFQAGVPLRVATAIRLRSRARNGPWLEHRDDQVAWAPFGAGPEPLGVLALVPNAAPAHGPGGGGQLLAAAIDFAVVAAGLITTALLKDGADARHAELGDLLSRQAFRPVFQPIVSLDTGSTIGFEALTRFTDGSEPQVRFAEAGALNRGIQLETATLAAALRAAANIPPSCWVSVNVSPALVLEGRLLGDLLESCPATIVLELTEHDPVEDYAKLSSALAELRPAARLSIDDAGSGFASLRHVLALEPDFVKLDQSWVSGIEGDPARQALVAGLRHFAQRTGSVLIAEGVETDPERGMLTELDVDLAQGYLFGRPASLSATV
jgi:EAL domain-containing protein (putative c-di-GMP-specific phosphodiesterase class I)